MRSDKVVRVTPSALRRRMLRLVAKWRLVLGIEDWDITVAWEEEDNYFGTCIASPQYEEAKISFNLRKIKGEVAPIPGALEELVLHELVHCVIWKNNERAVTQVTRAILRAYDMGCGKKVRCKVTGRAWKDTRVDPHPIK